MHPYCPLLVAGTYLGCYEDRENERIMMLVSQDLGMTTQVCRRGLGLKYHTRVAASVNKRLHPPSVRRRFICRKELRRSRYPDL